MGSDNWPEVRLGDHVDLLTGFPFKSAEFTDDAQDVRLVRGDNVVQGRFRWDGVRRWPRTDVDEFGNYLLEPGDVTLAMDRPWVEAGLKYAAVSAEDQPCLLVQRVSRLRGTNGLSTRYLRYVIGSPAFTEYVLAVQTGTAVPHISGRQIADFRFALPSVAEQERIADVLGMLDEKIELNRRVNRTLESIARAIFKSWFVDFDPMRKKMEGGRVRPPSGPACFFPGEFRESPVGLIPNGWQCRPLGDVAQFTKGRSYERAELGPSETALVTLKSFRRGGGYREDGLKDYVGPHRPEQVVDVGDVLVAHTDVTQAAEVLGRAVRVRSSSRHKTLVASLDTVVVRPTGDHLTREFLFFALDNDRFRDHAYGYSNGTTVLHLGAKALPEFPLVVPPAGLVAAFSGIVESLLARADLLGEENASLATVRDRLLPELMAGRLPPRRTAVVAGSTET